MRTRATSRRGWGVAMPRLAPGRTITLLLALLMVASAWPQNVPAPLNRLPSLQWAPFGNNVVLAGIAGYAGGPVDRVWRGSDDVIFVRLPDGSTWRTQDFASWQAAPDAQEPPLPESQPSRGAPRDVWLLQAHPMQPGTLFGLGRQVYRSVDTGRTFAGLTRYRGVSLLGEDLRDLCLHPNDPNDLLVASDLGLWRSRDGGESWFPASTTLDNLPIKRIVAFPEGRRGLVVEQPRGTLIEWLPGAVHGWRPRATEPENPWAMPAPLVRFGDSVQAWDAAGSHLYAALEDGPLVASSDAGVTWTPFTLPGWAAIRQIVVNPALPTLALALMEDDAGRRAVLRTLNGGQFWDEFSPPDITAIEAIAADWEHQVLLLALEGALAWTEVDFQGMARPAQARRIAWEGLRGELRELRLDPSGTVLFAVTARAGLFTAPLPAEIRGIRIRHAADLRVRPLAPGDLLSIHGAPLLRLRASGQEASVLGQGDHTTQVQLPYSIPGERAALELEFAAGNAQRMTLPLQRVSPAIFLHPDGGPFVLHGESGVFIDETFPASPGERIQVLASGLGAVRPDWPAGLPVPAGAPPSVTASVEVRVNGLPVRVERAILAPGYAGIYLVEIVLPAVMDEGLAELMLLADGVPSNVAALHVAYH